MGYYSFYRIFKDIIRTILGSKFLKIYLIGVLVFTFLFIIGDISCVKAADFSSVGLPPIDDLLSPGDYYLIIYRPSSDTYNLYIHNKLMYYLGNKTINGQNDTTYNLYFQTTGCKFYILSNGSWDFVEANAFNYSRFATPIVPYCVASNFDLRNYQPIVGNDDIVFNESPLYDYPVFNNVSDITNGYPDGVYISPRDYSTNDDLYFHLLKINYTQTAGSDTVYYYSDHIFKLNSSSSYIRMFNGVTPYYYIPRYALSLEPNFQYLYVLNNSAYNYDNSIGLIDIDEASGVYDVLNSDTTGVVTIEDSNNDKLQSIDNALTNDTPEPGLDQEISNNLTFDNSNEELNNINTGFFSRLLNLISSLSGYSLAEDSAIALPIPYSEENGYIVLHSNILYNNTTSAFRVLIGSFWLYVFSFYMYSFINKLYIAVSTGNILDTFSSEGEAITRHML